MSKTLNRSTFEPTSAFEKVTDGDSLPIIYHYMHEEYVDDFFSNGNLKLQTLFECREIEDDIRSVIFVQNHDSASESVSVRSQAILDCLSALGGIWRVVSWLRIIPGFFRDTIYNFIAANRYKWFGKYEECIVPSPEFSERFLE